MFKTLLGCTAVLKLSIIQHAMVVQHTAHHLVWKDHAPVDAVRGVVVEAGHGGSHAHGACSLQPHANNNSAKRRANFEHTVNDLVVCEGSNAGMKNWHRVCERIRTRVRPYDCARAGRPVGGLNSTGADRLERRGCVAQEWIRRTLPTHTII